MVAEIERAYQRCRDRYPTVQLQFDEFRVRLRTLLDQSVALAEIHCEDLYLASACAAGDSIAWEYFAEEYVPAIRRFAAQACRNSANAEDLAQELVRSLLEDRHRIGAYSGRGSLLSWLRVTVSRAAIDRFRRIRSGNEVPLEEAVDDGGIASGRGDLRGRGTPDERLDARWGVVLSQVLEEEIRRLAPEDRLLLGLYYVEGVPLRSIAGHFRVHESTVSRRLDGLRAGLKRRVQKELHRKHGLRPREVESLWEYAADSDVLRVERAVR